MSDITGVFQGHAAADALAFRDAFFQQHPEIHCVFRLFEQLPGVLFYAKDDHHR